jgi:ribosome-associated translation inhibitor RaiA
VEILFQSHNAVISDFQRGRARKGIEKVAARLNRVVHATVRFEQDGPTRRVEIVLHAPRMKRLIAEGRARSYGPALSAAIQHLESQAQSEKRPAKQRARRLTRV